MGQPGKLNKKVCMLGTFAVGKTSLVRQYVYSQFTEDYLSTIGVQLSTKSVELENPKTNKVQLVNLIIWDLAHLERFDAVIKNYLHGAHAAVVVLDLTRPQSFSEYDGMIRSYFEINPNSKILLVGNKADLSNENEPREIIRQMAADLNCDSFFASAKTGANVNTLFLTLAQTLM